MERDLEVLRLTATPYLGKLLEDGFLHKQKRRRGNDCINIPLTTILAGH